MVFTCEYYVLYRLLAHVFSSMADPSERADSYQYRSVHHLPVVVTAVVVAAVVVVAEAVSASPGPTSALFSLFFGTGCTIFTLVASSVLGSTPGGDEKFHRTYINFSYIIVIPIIVMPKLSCTTDLSLLTYSYENNGRTW